MFKSQMSPSPNGGDDIRSATAIMRQRLGKPQPYGMKQGFQRLPRPGAGGPQGIDPSQVMAQGGQQSFTGRGGNQQMIGQAMARKLAQQQPQQQAPPISRRWPPPSARDPSSISDSLRNAVGGGASDQFSKSVGPMGGEQLSDAMLAAQGGAPGQAPDMPQMMPTGASGPMRQPTPLQGGQYAQAMQSRGLPPTEMAGAVDNRPDLQGAISAYGQGAQGGQGAAGLPPAFRGSGNMPPGADVNKMAGFGPNAQGGPQPYGQGLPPQLMQRLQAMRAGRGGGASPYASLISGALGGVAGA